MEKEQDSIVAEAERKKRDHNAGDSPESAGSCPVFTGEVVYDAQTVRKMEKIRYRTFSLVPSAVRILCGVVMVVCGYLTGGAAGTIFVAFGCILTVSGDVTGRWRADQTVKALGGNTIHVRYEFYGDHFLSIADGKPLRCGYAELIVLMEDSRYFYLYPNEYQVYLIAADSVPGSDQEAFRRLLAGKAGLAWIRPLYLISANLKTIVRFQKAVSEGKKKKTPAAQAGTKS